MTVTVALVGDTMLGRGVGQALARTPPSGAAWTRRRFRSACAALGTTVDQEADRLTINWR